MKGIAPSTFVAQSPLQRCINGGGHAEQVESKRSGIGISRNKAKYIYQKIILDKIYCN